MDEYDRLMFQKYEIKEKIKDVKRRKNIKLRQQYKFLIRSMDIALICMVLFNAGALMITNALVMRENPNMELVEANPIQAEINDFQTETERITQAQAVKVYLSYLFQILVWTILIFCYIYYRSVIINSKELFGIAFFILLYFLATFF